MKHVTIKYILWWILNGKGKYDIRVINFNSDDYMFRCNVCYYKIMSNI